MKITLLLITIITLEGALSRHGNNGNHGNHGGSSSIDDSSDSHPEHGTETLEDANHMLEHV